MRTPRPCAAPAAGRCWIVPDGLWETAKLLIPPSKVRPQGGGTQDTPDETLFAAIIYVLVSGCAWRGPSHARTRQPTFHRPANKESTKRSHLVLREPSLAIYRSKSQG
ncbi:transposase [Streptomyces sp. NPDC046862]|uniref:transposase n=1 Tax=Streptomyces sp. NPDC046862 TaxID=3154603 RepID=UPI00345377A0